LDYPKQLLCIAKRLLKLIRFFYLYQTKRIFSLENYFETYFIQTWNRLLNYLQPKSFDQPYTTTYFSLSFFLIIHLLQPETTLSAWEADPPTHPPSRI
jgi:hypothetical protein